MKNQSPNTRKMILFGVAVAIPLAAVALYFALLDQPSPAPPTPQAARPAPPPAAPGTPPGEAAPPQAALPPDHPPIGGQPGSPPAPTPPGAPAGHPQMGGAGRSVRVPEEIKGKWEAVRLRVEEKGGRKPPQVFTVKLGGQLAIPGSKLRVQVGDFLPALQVKGGEVTSASNDPSNPAVLVAVSEGGKETFRGWLFSKFPEMQPFEHPTFRITLVEGIPAG